MGCGSSTAVLPEGTIMYDGCTERDSKHVRSSSSMDSGVGNELGSDEPNCVGDDQDALPDVKHIINGQSFAERRPLPPHPFEATFTDRTLRSALPLETNNEVERLLRPVDHGAEFLVAGKPLRPLRGKPPKHTSQKKIDLIGAQAQAKGLGDSLLNDLNDFDNDTHIGKRPPSRGGLAFDVVFGDSQDLDERALKLKKRQNKAPKLQRKHSNASVKKKLIEADLRRQKQQLDTIVKLQSIHETVGEIGARSSKMEEIKRKEMKKAQEDAMERAILARKQHLEDMRDKIRAKNEKIVRTNEKKLRRGCPSPAPATTEKLPSLLLLGF